ncbi:hypothetical protein ACFLR1_00965, partial [Bacteroidota bacterium]
PFPLFSFLIYIIWAFLHPMVTYVVYGLLNAIYTFSVFGIADSLINVYSKKSRLLLFSTMFFFVHANELWSSFLGLLSGLELAWVWDSGITEQGVLRGYLQPSVFGVFLILSLYFFLKKSVEGTFLALAVAAIFHANYVLIGGLMGAFYFSYFYKTAERKQLFIWVAVSTIAVLPYLIYIVLQFIPEVSEGTKVLDNAVLTTMPNNPHLDLKNWYTPKTFLQIIVLVAALISFRKTLFGKALLAFSVVGVVLSIAAFAVDSTVLMSLNPWRISVAIIPLASVMLLWKLLTSKHGEKIFLSMLLFSGIGVLSLIVFRLFGNAAFLSGWKTATTIALLVGLFATPFIIRIKGYEKAKTALHLLLIITLFISGTFGVTMDLKFRNATNEHPMMSFMQRQKDSANLCIIPTEMSDFRLATNCAVVADKNLVYGKGLAKQLERIAAAENFYAINWTNETAILDFLDTYHANRLIVPASKKLPPLHQITNLYNDKHFVILGK